MILKKILLTFFNKSKLFCTQLNGIKYWYIKSQLDISHFFLHA